MKKTFKLFLMFLLLSHPAFIHTHDLKNAVKSSDRTESFKLRDEFRHPYETLTFFKIKPDISTFGKCFGGGFPIGIISVSKITSKKLKKIKSQKQRKERLS